MPPDILCCQSSHATFIKYLSAGGFPSILKIKTESKWADRAIRCTSCRAFMRAKHVHQMSSQKQPADMLCCTCLPQQQQQQLHFPLHSNQQYASQAISVPPAKAEPLLRARAVFVALQTVLPVLCAWKLHIKRKTTWAGANGDGSAELLQGGLSGLLPFGGSLKQA